MMKSPPLSPRVLMLHTRLNEMAPEQHRAPASGGSPEKSRQLHEPFHAAFAAHEHEDLRIRLAQAQAAEMAAVQPVIHPGELIIGGDALRPIVTGRATPFGNRIRIDAERARELAEDHPALAPRIAAIMDYWQNMAERGEIPGGLTCHASLAWERVLEMGLDGLREYVQRHREQITARRPETDPWYAALLITLDGVSSCITAHGLAAQALAESMSDFAAREELRRIGDGCLHVAHGKPRSFAEAVQLFYLVFWLCGHDSPGPIDRYLWPPLQAELSAGTTTLPQAQEIVDCLWIKFAEKTAYGVTLGGQYADGTDACNPLSHLCLEAIRRLRLLSPRTTARWYPGLSPEFLTHACEVIAEGPSYPAFVNDEAVIAAATARGMELAHAREYTFVGCGQVYPHGRGHGNYEDITINSAKPLEWALHNGRNPASGEQCGPATGELEEFADFDALLCACRRQVDALVEREISAMNRARAAATANSWDFLRSLLTYSCVERGLDWHAGGADYSEGMVNMVGLTTLLDSLLAVRHVVYEAKMVTLPELVAALDTDWAGQEALRQYCLRQAPKFGNDDPAADAFIQSESARINKTICSFRTYFDGPWGMDIIGWSGAVLLGEQTGATPDGRRRGEALADCAGPAQGRNVVGLTATLNSVLHLPHDRAHGPLALSLRFPSSAMRGTAGAALLQSVVETYFRRGGQQLQISIAGTEEMKAALENPEAYRSLMVRIGGFSAWFTQLDPRWQQDLIARSEMENL